MLIIKVKDGDSIEKVLKKYKRKFDRTRVVRQLRSRQQFIKPSIKKRQQKIKAIHKQKLNSQEEA